MISSEKNPDSEIESMIDNIEVLWNEHYSQLDLARDYLNSISLEADIRFISEISIEGVITKGNNLPFNEKPPIWNELVQFRQIIINLNYSIIPFKQILTDLTVQLDNQSHDREQISYIVFSLIAIFIILFAVLFVVFFSKNLTGQFSQINTFLNNIFNSMPALLISTDIEGRIVRMNPVAEKLSGWDFEKAQGKVINDIFNMVHDKTRKPVANPVEEVLSIGRNVSLDDNTILISKDGEEHYITDSAAPIRNSEDIITGVVMAFQDITKRKEVEVELKYLRNYLSNIIDSMPSILIGVDIQGFVTLWNKTAEESTGIHSNAAQGKILSDVFPQLTTVIDKVIESIRSGQVKQVLKRSRIVENITYFEDVTIFPLVANGVQGAVIRIDDVTEKAQIQEMMVQNEKMLSMGGLAAGMAHEINNPLAGIMQTAGVLQKRLQSSKIQANNEAAEKTGTTMKIINDYMEARDVPRMFKSIAESGKRASEIVLNMLNFARKNDNEFSTHSLEDIIERSIKLAATDYDSKTKYDFKQIEIVRDYRENLPPILCEESKILQVILNVLRNGSQAMHDAKTENPQLKIYLKLFSSGENHRVSLEIEDNGPGMDEKIKKRIFDPFFTTKPVGEGTGLGLSVSYFIVTEIHSGEMLVESKPGKGTKFIIRFPI